DLRHLHPAGRRSVRLPKCFRRLISQTAVRPRAIIFFSPRRNARASLPQVPKPTHIQTLIAKLVVEAFHVRVLHWLAWLYVSQLEFPIHSPAQKCLEVSSLPAAAHSSS